MKFDWVPPIPLDAPRVPAFPLHALSSRCREYVAAVAEAMQVPVDLWPP